MKQAVQKLSAKYEEMFAGLSVSKDTGCLGAKVMLNDTMFILHSDGVITDNEFKEAMEEIDRIYPVKN